MTKKLPGLRDFQQLTFAEQVNLLHRDGVHVGKRVVNGKVVILFQLYGFYVEVYYRHYRKIIHRFHTTEDTCILHPYLDQIHIHDLENDPESQ